MENLILLQLGMIKWFKLASHCHITHIYIPKNLNLTPCGDHIQS